MNGRAFAIGIGMLAARAAFGQHLIWKPATPTSTCLYGEVDVLSTGRTIYYCGCNWWPGNAAGGYTGIQDADDRHHNMIFSIWDTSDKLLPKVVEAESRAVFSRFGGEGTGAHTHLNYDWKVGKTYRWYAAKQPDAATDSTLTRVYFYDEGRKRWIHEATISNPNGGFDSVKTFGGMLNAFLENWSGQERNAPKLALYRLWTGSSPADLQPVTEATGDGKWGIVNGSFYLAEGDEALLAPVIAKAGPGYVRATSSAPLHIAPPRLERSVVRALGHLPRSPKTD